MFMLFLIALFMYSQREKRFNNDFHQDNGSSFGVKFIRNSMTSFAGFFSLMIGSMKYSSPSSPFNTLSLAVPMSVTVTYSLP